MKDNLTKPPGWPRKIVTWFCREEHQEVLLGDLDELYEYRLETVGKLRARLHYIKDAFDMLRPFALKQRKSKLNNNQFAMLKNYLKISLRTMRKNKLYSSINIVGLAAGISCFLLIAIFVKDELSFDRFHEKADRIYRVNVDDFDNAGELAASFAYGSPKQAPVLRQELAQVETSVRFFHWNFPVIEYGDKKFEESFFNFVEPTIFDIFSFNFLEGDAQNALDEPNSLVINESNARKYFGEETAFGKVLKVKERGMEISYKITGVVEDFPEQSHMSYGFFASWSTFENAVGAEAFEDFHGNYNYPTYLLLKPNASIAAVEAQMPALQDKYVDNIDGDVPSTRTRMVFQPLTAIHLDGRVSDGVSRQGNIYYVYLFSAIGVLVLLIACVNYMNLATAKYAKRMKEIGVRKVMGASRKGLSRQFLVESVVYAFFSLIIGYVVALVSLPMVNGFVGKNLSLNPLDNPSLLGSALVLALLIGLISGSYPAAFMARFETIRALNGSNLASRKSWFRTSLVVFQFMITIGLIIGVTVIEKQMNFIEAKDPGYNREHVVNFWASPAVLERLETFKDQLKSNPNVLASSASSQIPTEALVNAFTAVKLEGSTSETMGFRLPFVWIDENYLDLYDLELVAGKNVPENPPADSLQRFLINELAVSELGWESAEEAIGKRLEYGRFRGFVSGVVKDFHFESFHQTIMPMILFSVPPLDGEYSLYRNMSVKVTGTNLVATMQFLEDNFKRYNPDRTFNPQFLDDAFQDQYESERNLSSISRIFSGLAILIACLGLLGLIGFSAEQRAKEISIRKVLGASVTNLVALMNLEYLRLIGISFVLALPGSYYLLNNWLSTFAYRIQMGVGVFMLSALVAMLLAIGTISFQSIKTAMANPVDALKNE